MSAALQFLDSDGVTVITTKNSGNIPSPGQSSQFKVFLQNTGNQTAQSLTVSIQAIGTNDGNIYAQLALDNGGVPGTFGTSPLSLGNLTAGSSVPFWFQEVLPAGVTADNNQRRYSIQYSATTL